jgi:hypothetical protein
MSHVMTDEEKIAAAIAILEAAREPFEKELRSLVAKRYLSGHEEAQKKEVLLTLRQIDDGVAPGEGVDARLDAVLQRPEIRRLAPVRPCLGNYRHVLANVKAAREKAEADAADAKTWPRAFKLKPGFRHRLSAEQVMEPGEVLLLGKSSYQAFRDRFDPAGPKDPQPLNI